MKTENIQTDKDKALHLGIVSDCLIDITHAGVAFEYAKKHSDNGNEIIIIAQHYYNGMKQGISGMTLRG